ncbi:hypothetical protein [Microbacterium sp. SLBN-111]|uniref:hypothetical protein n=1 Tax=Microbacterium sp. SLBN-111 TaxID=3377733 RepID=UPI003C787596
MNDLLLHTIAYTSTMPNIQPDYSAPFFVGFVRIVSYLLGAALVITLGLLIAALLALGFSKLAPERARVWAGESIGTIAIVIVCLGSASGIFQWLVGFNFGF